MSALVTTELLDRVRERLTASSVAEPTAATVADAVRAESSGVLADTDLLEVVRVLQTELTGAGPLEPLLHEPGVADVLVTAPDQVWVDRGVGLERSGVPVHRRGSGASTGAAVGTVGRSTPRRRPTVGRRPSAGRRRRALRGTTSCRTRTGGPGRNLRVTASAAARNAGSRRAVCSRRRGTGRARTPRSHHLVRAWPSW